MKHARIDKPLAFLIFALVTGGSLIFVSAAFGLLGRGFSSITSVAFNHLVLGVGGGTVLLIIALNINYRYWRQFAPYIFAFALAAMLLVFVPNLGFAHGGGQRWIVFFGVSFQPSEFLKIASIFLAAAYYSAIRTKTETFTWGVGGLAAILIAPVVLLVMQPDIGTLGIICMSVVAIFFAAGARMRDIAILLCVALISLAILASVKVHVKERIVTFFNPSQNQQTESYQITQSLIAIGSGQVFGRGLGQGVQKFTYLPEAMGDSIFAVAGEEFGFIGSGIIVLLFLALALRGYVVAARTTDMFGGLLAVGISTYLAGEAFINIAAMLGMAPLTGVPLTFVSQGGSAMLISLLSAGILLNISRQQKRG
ncbi:hypothetical protein A3D71_01475 [Candidatus Kaiserbacteria bacterium RIFCSPHIGHO2_02_FULL_55_20]|uniref:Probable peptidoglycan glycosyltransferase FtsW n=1 Tax=Candidatus Kaiserbacteria bacterium RIFCSPHIGHO2_02_FULL_55_20 TaxID=1798497 RepID=A0A1F6DXL1_9BACT|nr:MAG: hypothetical protein A2680_03580 [Candidatus Kaiserbacteria bacterium RIFCSPHIGHO2_01_FULL_55_37]OGG66169.1 MAG: hypothetical protein A3D71_01475 [Candidatus Kaiserbacteria bacterium RIFCSPHIGHO2_02_FULL_55_20]